MVRPWLSWSCLLLTSILIALIHFHGIDYRSRELIDFDDHKFIQPLKTLSFSQYVKEWRADPENYAFLLRDLTFFLDFKLSDALGVPTFWYSNFVFYLIFLYFIFKIFQLYLLPLRWVSELLVAFVAVHPSQIEIIQWASNRKHLLVGLIVSMGSYYVLKLKQSNSSLKVKNWIAIFLFYTLGWLCWPSISLWILWVFYLFRDQKFPHKTKVIILGILICILGLLETYSSKVSYSQGSDSISGSESFLRSVIFGFEAIGRAAWNIFAPIGLVPYYRVHNYFNWFGWLFIIGAVFAWHYLNRNESSSKSTHVKKQKKIQKTSVQNQAGFNNLFGSGRLVWSQHASLVVALFLPQCFDCSYKSS